MKLTRDYGAELDRLDASHAAGKLGPGAYAVRRARILAEASRDPRQQLVTVLALIVLPIWGFVALVIAVWFAADLFG